MWRFLSKDGLVRVLDSDDGRIKNMRACETDVQRREQQSIGLQRIASVLCQLSIDYSPFVVNVEMIDNHFR